MKKYKIKQENAILLLAFLLPVVIMLLLFIVKSIYPFGNRSFLSGDLYHQYMPFFSELIRRIRGGECLDFSFNAGIGSNFMALFVYYLASPFHILGLLIPVEHEVEFLSYLVVFKTGLCGLTACLYFQRHFETKDRAVLLFSMFYAFSGFMAAYNYNIMWLDCIWVLPLILLGLERLVKEGRWGLYCLTLAFSIFTNYYLSIMICIFLVLYFGVLLITERKNRLRSIGYFAVFSALAGGLSAVLLIPEVCAILQTDFGNAPFPEKVESYFSVLDMLARHCVCVYTERGLDHWPNIYCGSAVLMLIPMYLMNRRISIRERFCRMGLAAFLLISFSTNILNFIWHGLNYPDSLPARQSFLYVFLVLTMAYDAYRHLDETDTRQILCGYITAVGFLMFCEKFVDHEDFELGVKLLTLVFVTVYAVLLYLYRTRQKKSVRWGVGAVALAVVLTECSINTWDTSIGTTDREAYLNQQEDYRALYRWTQERTPGFYRVEKFTRKTKNDATLTGYPSASIFSSTLNSDVMDLYNRLGMRHSKVYYGFDGATGLTSALLNVEYMFGDSEAYDCSLYTKVAESGDICLYQCNENLPFGYTAPLGFDIPEGYESQPMSLQNRIVRELGLPGQLFREAEKRTSGDDVQFTAKEGGIYYGLVTASGTAKITCIGGSRDEETLGDLKRGCILYLGYLEAGQTITLKNGDEKDETPKISVDIYQMNEELLAEALAKLESPHLEEVQWESDAVSGRIALEEPRRLILSIPYEDGWTVWMNGEKKSGELFGGCLMAFDLEPGEYEIVMKYRPAGAAAGIVITMVSIAILAGITVLTRRHRLRGNRENAHK